MTSPGPSRRNRLVYTVSRFAMLCVSKVWFRLRTEGSAHLPSDGPVLLVGNHSSYLDPPLMGMGVGRQVNFLAQAGAGLVWAAAVVAPPSRGDADRPRRAVQGRDALGRRSPEGGGGRRHLPRGTEPQ